MGLLTGTPLWTFVVSCRERPRRVRSQAGAVAGGRDGGQLVWGGARVTRARPPAVAVIGLRRSGRTGNGESPRGRSAPACQPGRSVHTRFRGMAVRRDYPRRQAHGALCAPLKTYRKSSRATG
jgi:hypothetical protein